MTMHRSITLLAPALLLLAQACATTPSADPSADPPEEARTPEEYVAAGNRAYATGERDKALVQYLLALEGGNRDASTFHRIGTIQRGKGDAESAERSFRQALAIDPESLPSREGLGLIQLERENYALAETMLTSVIEADPTSEGSLNALGIMFDLQERHEEAQARYEEALALNPRSARLLNNLGYSYYLEGRDDLAEARFEEALRIDDDYDRAWSNLALVYARRGDDERARRAFEQVVEEHRSLNNLGYLHLLMGEGTEARESFERSLDAAPSHYDVALRNLEALDGEAGSAGRPDGRRVGRRAARIVPGGLAASGSETGALEGDSAATDIAPQTETPVEVTRGVARRLQRGLAQAGFNPGPTDGKLGSKSLGALRLYKASQGMPVNGKVTAEVLAWLERS